MNAYAHSAGLGAAFRVIPNSAPALESLGMPPVVRKFTEYQNGLVLVCGPTGSGKTTTLAAMVNEINTRSKRHRHIITIEDPVEFVHEPVNAVITQRQVGAHTKTFAHALRSALREAPDVIVVGELRDLETIGLALTAAETGVLVFGTLHTNSAAKAIDRILDAFPADSREHIRGVLSVVMRGVVAQLLARKSDGEGRIVLLEVLVQTIAVAHMIREGKTHQLHGLLTSDDQGAVGMQSLDGCIARYVKQGRITLDEGLKFANDPTRLKNAAAGLTPTS